MQKKALVSDRRVDEETRETVAFGLRNHRGISVLEPLSHGQWFEFLS